MNRLRPGSIPWLLAWELRLSWRGAPGQGQGQGQGQSQGKGQGQGHGRGGGRKGVAIVFALVLLVLGLPLGLLFARLPLRVTPAVVVGLDIALLFVFTLMLSTALGAAILAFQVRGDLDLLLSSPLSGRKVLAVRTAAIAGRALLGWAALATPFLLPAAVMGRWPWLAAYPTLAALALVAAAGGVGLAMSLFRLVGARAARTLGQVLGALIGAGVYLASQAFRMFPAAGHALGAWIAAGARAGLFAPVSPLSWPARAALGEPGPLAAMMVLSLAAFALTARALGRGFVANAALSVAGGSGRAARPHGARGSGFAPSPFGAVVRKEWRLLLRDPALISQILTRGLYLAPLLFLAMRHGASHDVALMATAGPLALIIGQTAGILAWTTLSGEDAPDLIAASPIPGPILRRARLAAALQATAAPLAIVVAGLAIVSPRMALAVGAGSAASAVSAALINLWLGKPGKRQGMNGRRRGSPALVFAELGVGLGWSIATGIAAFGSPWCLVPAGLTLLALGGLKVIAEPDRGL